jgi:hypothetical protein
MQALEEPSWEFIKARVEWLMAGKSKAYDDLAATRQAIYQQPGLVKAGPSRPRTSPRVRTGALPCLPMLA